MSDVNALLALVTAAAVGAVAYQSDDIRDQLGLDSSSSRAVVVVPGEVSPPPEPPRAAAAAGSAMATITQIDAPRTLGGRAPAAIVTRARQEVENGVRYDATYKLLSGYPNGDIPADRGACTDVVIRAFRAAGVDLQVLVHDDILADRSYYGFDADPNVDHRRAPTLYSYFVRNTIRLPDRPQKDASSFQAGDVVFYAYKKKCFSRYPCAPEHVAIVSDRIGPRGLPLIIQNGGPRATEADALDHGKMLGHFRFPRTIPHATAP